MIYRSLSNEQFKTVEEFLRSKGESIDTCPTCGARPEYVDENTYGEEHGTYRYRGQECACDCKTQKRLYRHYIAAEIPEQYMRLDWNDFIGENPAEDLVENYLARWKVAKKNGMGFIFYSTQLGTGKTFAATYVARELVKRGERVFFIRFNDMKELFEWESERRWQTVDRLKTTTVVVLDEVKPPRSDAQQWLFSEKFEQFIRHRTDRNLPTILTSNMTEEDFNEHYPRVYSLLRAKCMRVEMPGLDRRQADIEQENLELLLNGEVHPIV